MHGNKHGSEENVEKVEVEVERPGPSFANQHGNSLDKMQVDGHAVAHNEDHFDIKKV